MCNKMPKVAKTGVVGKCQTAILKIRLRTADRTEGMKNNGILRHGAWTLQREDV